ncbi:transcription termination factor NusA [Candidatus Roizmanbacteria bacterium RIFCSPHIGHO2_02_FULL_37_15]|uniref:Transcription termination/antitermination protein NusA n=1 Tax=Candidatus Roizmanbacteria bacterium RIFCSPLOWO2_01_FULL_37_16 TaxID=1802058 RepID=A0A1F7IPR7_9BACT|nr:MAG: transcription termination factor NusA [Candidatus Roizmanbacteria bacterium RIFCSPHIGHO2_01_FULL_37_16b]OGK21495.1 MAG: transcription termination factor NusA [Candidatus Roizmanbacteria bacterium RIFCSPHIGHO2_02_FULL_37_15]OGK34135.1 MAG: transcription termination factor NusA [Candidatus Roizmanbacteria bacterium RIFCSPHIGHO2_12_FULL_36_11]OGK45365.1 MAG: transcription termination factor NusA [Candidatus Roizmanbacteria bacterium RIFCSPLOWO2_01_FULL_37_16]
MTIVKSEFALALNQVATERGISVDDVLKSIEAAILAAYKKDYPDKFDDTISAKISRETGETKIFKDEKDITPHGFGRIAAQTAKQVILQKIREAEKKTVVLHYRSQIGKAVKGRIIRYDGRNAFLDIGKTEALLPQEEQIKNERYQINDTLVVYIKNIIEDKFGNTRIILSRIDGKLIEELFKREVPEIQNGTVQIKKVVREPGERAKIAVYSSQGGVDPVGACVGQKGIRVQTVTDELGGKEKIDIIQWNKDDKLFLLASLSPAKSTNVELENSTRKAKVFVDEDQAPLAIGSRGVNVNLASRLTDYNIDIVQNPIKTSEKQEEAKPTSEIKGAEKQVKKSTN